MDPKVNEVREAIAGISQGSVQRALYLILELIEDIEICSCKADMKVDPYLAMPPGEVNE